LGAGLVGFEKDAACCSICDISLAFGMRPDATLKRSMAFSRSCLAPGVKDENGLPPPAKCGMPACSNMICCGVLIKFGILIFLVRVPYNYLCTKFVLFALDCVGVVKLLSAIVGVVVVPGW